MAFKAKARSRISVTFSAWTKRLNPQAWWAKLERPAKPAVPRFSKAPVQGELSLDNVKVVRNDLSEADLEIVVTKSMGRKAASERAEQTEAAGELIKA